LGTFIQYKELLRGTKGIPDTFFQNFLPFSPIYHTLDRYIVDFSPNPVFVLQFSCMPKVYVFGQCLEKMGAATAGQVQKIIHSEFFGHRILFLLSSL